MVIPIYSRSVLRVTGSSFLGLNCFITIVHWFLVITNFKIAVDFEVNVGTMLKLSAHGLFASHMD